jgi:hypothetical protein
MKKSVHVNMMTKNKIQFQPIKEVEVEEVDFKSEINITDPNKDNEKIGLKTLKSPDFK